MDLQYDLSLHPPLNPNYTEGDACVTMIIDSEVFGDSSTGSKPQHPMEHLHNLNSAGSIPKKKKEEKKPGLLTALIQKIVVITSSPPYRLYKCSYQN